MWTLYKKEIKNYFSSPIGYVILTVFAAIAGFFFYTITFNFILFCLQTETNYINPFVQTPNINEMVVRPIFSSLGFVFIIIIPMISMRLFAEEKSAGTIQILLTSPLKPINIILGKYFASLTFLLIMISVTFFYQLLFFLYSTPTWQPVLVGYIGLFLLGSTFLALGILISSLTNNQIIAVILTFGLFLFLWIIGWSIENTNSQWRLIAEYISFYNHYQDFSKGILDTKSITYFCSIIFFSLFLTHKQIQAYRWK